MTHDRMDCGRCLSLSILILGSVLICRARDSGPAAISLTDHSLALPLEQHIIPSLPQDLKVMCNLAGTCKALRKLVHGCKPWWQVVALEKLGPCHPVLQLQAEPGKLSQDELRAAIAQYDHAIVRMLAGKFKQGMSSVREYCIAIIALLLEAAHLPCSANAMLQCLGLNDAMQEHCLLCQQLLTRQLRLTGAASMSCQTSVADLTASSIDSVLLPVDPWHCYMLHIKFMLMNTAVVSSLMPVERPAIHAYAHLKTGRLVLSHRQGNHCRPSTD